MNRDDMLKWGWLGILFLLAIGAFSFYYFSGYEFSLSAVQRQADYLYQLVQNKYVLSIILFCLIFTSVLLTLHSVLLLCTDSTLLRIRVITTLPAATTPVTPTTTTTVPTPPPTPVTPNPHHMQSRRIPCV